MVLIDDDNHFCHKLWFATKIGQKSALNKNTLFVTDQSHRDVEFSDCLNPFFTFEFSMEKHWLEKQLLSKTLLLWQWATLSVKT